MAQALEQEGGAVVGVLDAARGWATARRGMRNGNINEQAWRAIRVNTDSLMQLWLTLANRLDCTALHRINSNFVA